MPHHSIRKTKSGAAIARRRKLRGRSGGVSIQFCYRFLCLPLISFSLTASARVGRMPSVMFNDIG